MTTCHMGSVLTIRLYEQDPSRHDDVECVGGAGPTGGLGITSEWSRLDFHTTMPHLRGMGG